MTSIIDIRDVSFHYAAGQPVLCGVSLTIEPGTTAIVGQNGAGKTTLMKLLNGLLKPTAGEVWVDGLRTSDYGTHEIAKRVGLIFQNPNDQIFKSSVLAEVMFGPLNVGMSEAEAKESALSALAMVELEAAVDDNPYDLSFAMRKRICIASILAMQTDVIVFDEPTISQDAAGLQLISGLIQRLKTDGKTVLAIVHDMNFAAENFDRVIAMAEGQVVADGGPEDVFLDAPVLARSHVDAPAMLKLSQALELPPTIDVDRMVEQLQSDQGSGAS